MDRVESYVFGNNLYQSSSESFSSPSSSASSSIGRNSEDDEGEENEVESPYKGPLDLMESLEEVLPVRKGISSYYNGKSKSFTNLTVAASSMKDLAKPENAYTRRRRSLLCHQIWENTPRGGISKRQGMSKSRSALTLAVAVYAGEGSSSSGGDSSSGSSPSPPRQMMTMLPPLYPRSKGSFGSLKLSKSLSGFCATRSYSVADHIGSSDS